ncbi:MAG TPA: SET domain-containing protein-lysine N-methyltransferase [Gaiellaceae bacterium]|nr:SET domain-containing protein-lysine N-methyltransferase [Gaiellaceae bacterium]
MKVCLLTDDYLDSTSPFKEHDLACDPRPYLPEADWHSVSLRKSTAVAIVADLAAQGFDVFFNLCDGAWGEDRPGIEVVQALERLGRAFTGATSEFYEPSREAMKRVCNAWGVDSPRYFWAATPDDVERAAAELEFPLIVKHPSSYSSIGMTRASRVETAADLRREAERTTTAYGAALVEEFVEGREFTVLVAENPDDPHSPTTYTPIEFVFPPGETFKHFDLKWVDHGEMSAVPVADTALDARLRELSAKVFRGLNGAGFARVDVRVRPDGRAFFLEINPNCGVYYPAADPGSADLCLVNDPQGHEGFTRQIVRAALRRRDLRSRPWEVRPTPAGGYGMFATRAIEAGERIVEFEQQPHTLVTRSHVERTWRDQDASWFPRYAWPLTDEVYVVWERDPEDWKPIDHSCEPNAWLTGLDLVARRDLAAGEEITVDYATFCNELMPSFECGCRAPGCRGTIRGDDYLQDFVARYDGHVSDYVARKRAAAQG